MRTVVETPGRGDRLWACPETTAYRVGRMDPCGTLAMDQCKRAEARCVPSAELGLGFCRTNTHQRGHLAGQEEAGDVPQQRQLVAPLRAVVDGVRQVLHKMHAQPQLM